MKTWCFPFFYSCSSKQLFYWDEKELHRRTKGKFSSSKHRSVKRDLIVIPDTVRPQRNLENITCCNTLQKHVQSIIISPFPSRRRPHVMFFQFLWCSNIVHNKLFTKISKWYTTIGVIVYNCIIKHFHRATLQNKVLKFGKSTFVSLNKFSYIIIFPRLNVRSSLKLIFCYSIINFSLNHSLVSFTVITYNFTLYIEII